MPALDPIVDAHLDLAYGALAHGWDLTLPLETLRQRVQGPYRPTVTLPALRDAGVAVAFATIFVDPERYPGHEEAKQAALAQIERYRRWEAAGHVRIIENAAMLRAHLEAWSRDKTPGLVLLMEGAEPIGSPDELPEWKRRGVRIVGLAWRTTRYAGGTGGEEGLLPLGRDLLAAMASEGVALDLSHLSEAAFFEALEHFPGPVAVSHANPRALAWSPESPVPANRFLSDAELRALKGRQGVVGVVLYNRFLESTWTPEKPRPSLARVVRHAHFIAEQLGWGSVGIGSDFDGGFGADATPEGIESPLDLRKLSALLPEEHAAGVLGSNWLRWLGSWL